MTTLLSTSTSVIEAHRLMAGQFSRLAKVRFARGKRTPLFFYSQVAWDTVWQRPQEEALGLSNYRPVIFFSPVQLHEWATRLHDKWKLVRRLNGGRLIVVSPLIFTGEYRSSLVRAANKRLLGNLAERLIGGDKHFFLTNTPFSAWMIEALRPEKVIADYIDDFASFGWAPSDAQEMEAKLLKSLDLTIAGTGYLQRRLAEKLNVKYLSSGVRFDQLTKSAAEPTELSNLPHPRALYVGTLNDRLDGLLFKSVAEAIPNGSVIVVGPRHETFRAPEMPQNVHFMGLKKHEQLPGYFQHCDIGLMPFGDSLAARAINPIKTLEYLACGLPVISTPIPDVIEYYPGVVEIAEPPAWPSAVVRMLAEDGTSRRAVRADFARDRTWDKLVSAFERDIRQLESK